MRLVIPVTLIVLGLPACAAHDEGTVEPVAEPATVARAMPPVELFSDLRAAFDRLPADEGWPAQNEFEAALAAGVVT